MYLSEVEANPQPSPFVDSDPYYETCWLRVSRSIRDEETLEKSRQGVWCLLFVSGLSEVGIRREWEPAEGRARMSSSYPIQAK